MQLDYISDFINGLVGGAVGITISYPWSTIKNRTQIASSRGDVYNFRSDMKRYGLPSLYNGFSSPFIGTLVEKSVLFAVFDHLSKKTNLNDFQKGIIAGAATTGVVTPYERIMIKCQTSQIQQRCGVTHPKINPTQVIRDIIETEGLKGFTRGYSATWLREVPGYAIYFYTYGKAKKYLPGEEQNIIRIMTSGALAGISAWTFIYPSDPIKTVMQNENKKFTHAISYIYKNEGLLGFISGIKPALIRAGLLHSGVFLGYELCKRYTS